MKKPTFVAMIAICICMSLAVFSGLHAAPKETIPFPVVAYPGRNVPIMGDAWSEAGTGYYDPRSYKPPKVPRQAEGNKDCVACHAKLTPRAVEDWRQSKHAQNSVGCAECHGTHPDLKMPLARYLRSMSREPSCPA